MVFLKAVLGSLKIMVLVGFVFLLFGLLGIHAWPRFFVSVEHLVSLFILGMGLYLFARY